MIKGTNATLMIGDKKIENVMITGCDFTPIVNHDVKPIQTQYEITVHFKHEPEQEEKPERRIQL